MADERNSECSSADASPSAGRVLPDFCAGETLFRVFVVAMLLALILFLLREPYEDPALVLFPIVLFVTWVAISSLLFVCMLQHWLMRLGLFWKIAVPTLIPVLNTALVHLGAEALFLADPEFRLRAVAVTALLSLIAMHYLYLVAAWKEETQRVLAAREQALRARVRPHFLFNSMNSIAGLCRVDPAKAEQITLDLADLFRSTFATGPGHTLRRELELVREYLNIEQTRFGDRLEIEWEVAESNVLDIVLPALVLQPLAENAIQHGIATARAGGRVWVRAREQANHVLVDIGNTVGTGDAPGTHTAGAELRARLRNWFGDAAGIESNHDKNGDFWVRVTIPIHRKQEAGS